MSRVGLNNVMRHALPGARAQKASARCLGCVVTLEQERSGNGTGSVLLEIKKRVSYPSKVRVASQVNHVADSVMTTTTATACGRRLHNRLFDVGYDTDPSHCQLQSQDVYLRTLVINASPGSSLRQRHSLFVIWISRVSGVILLQYQ